ncbi:MAG TPA: nucleotidyl transferase AbiEii/AbiGii toxin family protein, partial [Candidatus Dormibacteraeota bacterium]
EAQGARALRVPVVVYLGATRYAEFHVDLVIDLAMTGVPEEVEPLLPVDVPGLVCVPYRAYPLVDHIADKLCALNETHPRADGTLEGSTRYRDLADIVVFAHTSEPDAASLDVAIRSELGRRGLALPARFGVPGAANWRAGYARVARDVPGLVERDLTAAMATASSFVDPVLAGHARGRWSRSKLSWG